MIYFQYLQSQRVLLDPKATQRQNEFWKTALQDEFGIDEEQHLGYSRKEFQCSQSGSKYRMTQGIWTLKHPGRLPKQKKTTIVLEKMTYPAFWLISFVCAIFVKLLRNS